MMQDTSRHQGLRKQLVELLKKKGISNSAVLEAIGKVPRHFFMDTAFTHIAYEDQAVDIGCDQTISKPHTVAYQTQLLDPQKGEKILEIGTGSGYQSSVIAEMGAKLFTIERHKPLFETTKKKLEAMNYLTVKTFFGDGFKGLPAFAPFDKIIVTCGAPEIPKPLVEQLKIGGVMVIPVGEINGEQIMTTVIKKSATEFEIIELDKFRFVPMLNEKVR